VTFPSEIEAALSRPDSETGRLQRAVLERLFAHRDDDHLPTSARFLFYELEQLGVVSKETTERRDGKKGRRPDQNLIEALTHLRDRGVVPWDWIVDETRALTRWRYARTVADYLIDTVDLARVDCWGGKPPPVILTESRSLAGVLNNLAREYLVPVTSSNGQCRGHLHTEVAPYLVEGQRILSLTDYDLAGGHINDHSRRVLERLVGPLDWVRLAITREQAEALVARGVSMVNKVDKRHKPPLHYQAVETEALGHGEIVRIVREHLDGLLPEPLDVVREREGKQRKDVAELMRRLGEGAP
jgi:hypothetical protein